MERRRIELPTFALPPVRVYTKIAATRVTDDDDADSPTLFVSQNEDRLEEQETEMLQPADLVQLSKGQAFALLGGGRLYKLRLPLAGADPLLPESMDEIAAWARSHYGGSRHG